jgi:Flp pilus assembly protein TadG
VELAIALPAVTALLAVVLAVGTGVITQIRCADAARAGAREAALGSGDGQIAQVAGKTAGASAITSVDRSGDIVTVTVRVPLNWSGLRLPGRYEVTSRAHAKCEPDRGCT